ncbi:hypothetical protein GCM10028785_13250 [Hydrogenophaga soli]
MDALNASPDMVQLAARIQLSQKLLEAVRPLLPFNLRAQVQSGPVTDQEWCLLVNGNAASAKIRQLMPDLKQRIADMLGRELNIRIKILQQRNQAVQSR